MYEPPIHNKLPFKFDSSGYSPPDFTDVNFNFSNPTPIVDLKAAIIGSELERDYLKSCQEYVVGFNQNNLQILRHSCVYGGIRDLNAYMDVIAHFLDLNIYIKHSFPEQLNLTEIVKGFGKGEHNLPEAIKGWTRKVPINLAAYLKQAVTSQKDLSEYVNIFQASQINLREILKGWKREAPYDFFKVIKGIVKTYTDFPSYIKSTEQDSLDLIGDIYKIWQTNRLDLNKAIHGWQLADLGYFIRAFHYKDLPVFVRSTYLFDLSATLSVISPKDLSANVMSWAYYNLKMNIFPDPYRPGDIKADIYGIPPRDLTVFIQTRKEIEKVFDLRATIERFPRTDLQYLINAIAPMDLNAFITAKGYVSNLQCLIYPKVVFVKTLINVSYLENRDLKATVNFPCFNSAYRDLNYTLYSMHSVGLKAILFGTDGSNIKNLRILVNASDYIVQNKINVSCFNQTQHSTGLDVSCNRQQPTYYMDKLKVTPGRGSVYSSIGASIIGNYLTSDLSISILPYINPHYIEPNTKYRVITLKLNNNQEEWRKYVEVAFNDYVKSYYYFSGNQRAYKEFKDEHWEVRVQGYSLLNLPKGVDRSKVRTKYIFNLNNYDSIDAAIRDMIDRVTEFRHTDLSGSIFGSM